MNRRRSPFACSLLFLSLCAILGLAWSGGCEASRLPGCKSNADCDSSDDAKPGSIKKGVCYNLRCVECRYDGDCTDGKICNSIGECKSLGSGSESTSSSATGGATKPE